MLSFTLSLAYGVLLLTHLGCAQNLSIPSTWTNTSIRASRSQRIELAQAALGRVYLERYNEELGEFKDVLYAESSQVLISFAFKDYVMRTMENQFAVDALITAENLSPGFSGNIPLQNCESLKGIVHIPITWGLACIFSYRAYNQSSMLELAKVAWNQGNQYVISGSQAAHHSHPKKKFTFSGTCNGVSVEGGVFYATSSKDIRITTSSVGNFMTLSAHLAEITSEKKYQDAAILSANFLEAHMVDEIGRVIDVLGLNTTGDSCNKSATLLTADSGALIEGYMVLANATKDSSWNTRALRTLTAATHTHAWAYQDGIVSEGAEGNQDLNSHKNAYMRSLYEAWARSPYDDSLRTFIKTYVTVQYNGMLTYSTIPGSNIYGFSWHLMPKQDSLTTDGLLSSLNLLSVAAAIGGEFPTSFSPTLTPASTTRITPIASFGASSTGTTLPESKQRTNVAAIAAGVAVPLTVLLALITLILYLRHRRNRSKSLTSAAFASQVAMTTWADRYDRKRP